VDDQVGAPTWARFIAEVTAHILANGRPGPNSAWKHCGLYHLVAAGAVSWFGFAQAILAEAKSRDPALHLPGLVPISTGEYPLPARRPANSRLDPSRLSAMFGVTSPDWRIMLKQCMDEIAAAGSGSSRG
jgi:dTDP-4-dehydrorhamnose reductase